jgi:hypothetical protein
VWSSKAIQLLERKTRAWAKEKGVHPWDILLGLMESEKEPTRLAAIKLWSDLLAGSFTRQEIEVTRAPAEPAIYLPEMQPDPARVVQLKPQEESQA